MTLYLDHTNRQTDFNLATEEYLFKTCTNNLCMIWQNEPSVIVGKHQSVETEVNLAYTQRHQIPVYRRQSGGGSVYQDMGNLNITFIEHQNHINFTNYAVRMQKALKKMAIQTWIDPRNGLYINDLKISGSAQFVCKNKVLFHATLLYSSNLKHLTESLNSPYETNQHASDQRVRIASVKSPVTNISQYLMESKPMEVFKKQFAGYLLEEEPVLTPHRLSDQDLAAIENLRKNKYATHNWNFRF